MDFQQKLEPFRQKRILLLQGPVGPFFWNLAKALRAHEAEVFKINFNGGDWLFYPKGAVAFCGQKEELGAFIEQFCLSYGIDFLIMFNDCRLIHKIAIEATAHLPIEAYIFEEGYLRPNFITFEKKGVNANSTLSKHKDFYLHYSPKQAVHERQVKHVFRNMAWFAFLYWFGAFVLAWRFNNSLHHRSLSWTEMFPWFLSYFRKIKYQLSERHDRCFILKSKKRYFVAILQVYNDTQIKNHFGGRRIENFIYTTIQSFAKCAKPHHYLVIKHHPMDRGYKNYQKFIHRKAKQYNVLSRVIYVHDIHLPSLLSGALGCVVINSTVGLSAFYHKVPLKVCGEAFYNMHGLTYQESLDKFWSGAKKFKAHPLLYEKLKAFLVDQVQINGSFYARLD